MRSQVYLITGFLGAGKTTFLKRLVQALGERRLHIIVNEFGREGVDGALLRELGATLDEISNGSIFCSCRLDKFEETLDRALAARPDCILIEASGLSDPTNIRKIMQLPEFAERVDYQGAICLVDAVRFEKVYATARCCKKQLAAANLVLLNKSDLVSPEKLASVRESIHAQRPDVRIHETVRGALEPAWLAELTSAGGETPEAPDIPDITLQKHELQISPRCTAAQLHQMLRILGEDSYRIKGIVTLKEGVYLADCVGSMLSLTPCADKKAGTGQLQILAGQGLPVRRSLRAVTQQYSELTKLGTP
jgi:Putative GTPases (G3E family)